MKLNGIDVSRHQGSIDWSALKGKIDFAIIRAGYGNSVSQKDSKFDANYAGAKANKIPVGAYWYSYASGPEDARREAKACLEVIKGKTFEYPIWYDIEYEAVLMNQSKTSRTECCKAFCEELERAGYYAGIYCSRDYINNKLNSSDLKGYDLWVAAYTKTNNPGFVPIPYGMWQYSSTNALGISGFGNSLDCDVSYKDYPSIMKKAGLNGYGKVPSVWDTNGPWRIECATGADKLALKELCEAKGLKVANI